MGSVARRSLGACCLALLAGLLVAGLWPFGSPRNDAVWSSGRQGLHLGPHGAVFSIGSFPASTDSSACSVEVWARPRSIRRPGTLLAFYAADQTPRLRVRQSLSDLAIYLEPAGMPARKAKLYLDTFREGGPALVTVASRSDGASVYLDGVLTRFANGLKIPGSACTGRLVLGDSPRQSDTWSGELFGVAVYRGEVTAAAARRHYQAWMQYGRPTAVPTEGLTALYTFDEQSGSAVHDRAGAGADLRIPARYTLLDPVLLDMPWRAFHMSWGYWEDVAENILGFVPFGFCVCAYFAVVRCLRRPRLATLLSGFLVSLTIESLQVFLPTRDSDLTDLLTNTLGTILGIALFRAVHTMLTRNGSSTIGQPI